MTTATTSSTTLARATRWWPLPAVLALIALGVAVGKGSTPLDDWFLATGRANRELYYLLLFTRPTLLFLLLGIAAGIAIYRRRWRLFAAMVVTPAVALVAVRLLKELFGREKRGALAYPSGHVTITVIVLGMLVLAVGPRVWLLASAAVYAVLGLLGQAFTVHYFTDTIGALFLSTALLSLAAWATRVDRCQPDCDVGHSNG